MRDTQLAPGTIKDSVWPREPERPGERLYRDAAQRELKIKQQQILQDEVRRKEEDSEVTFRPEISSSQRGCQGVGRSMRDPEGKYAKKKLHNMREMKEKSSLDCCTFKPQIDQRSEVLMTQRLARMRVGSNLYEDLYEDALRRHERHLQITKQLPPGVTFHPDIGAEHFRSPNDDNKEDFVNRLAYSKSNSEKWLAVQRQHQDKYSRNLESVGALATAADAEERFHPQTGRGPLQERNKDGLPIWEFLYNLGQVKAAQAQMHTEQEQEAERSLSQARKIGDVSQQLFEDTKKRKYADIYQVLTLQDPDRRLRAATLSREASMKSWRTF